MILLNAEHIKKSYTEKPLLTDISLSIADTDKIGLIGVNGTGKSTLLKIIAGAMEAEGGSITRSRELRTAYLPQNPPYDPELTALEQAIVYLDAAGRPYEQYRCQAMLTKLGINDFDQKMGQLSGGQRKRVAMAAALTVDSNLLILDEPTNDLDIETLTILEDYLDDFNGAVIAVSHDRYFLDRVTRRTFAFTGDGRIKAYNGGYSDYEARRQEELAEEKAAARASQSSKGVRQDAADTSGAAAGRTKQERPRFTYKEQREYETIEEDIAALEDQLAQVEEAMEENATDFSRLAALSQEKEELDAALMEKLDRWEYLSELAEKIEKYRRR